MKFEKLTDAKIKIILSLEDLELNNVSIQNILNNSSSSQKLLQSMLKMAEKEVGFNTGNSRLLVEAIMSSEEECTFTITKLCETDIESNCFYSPFIFKFNCLDDFIDLCFFLKNMSNLNFTELSKNFSLILYNNLYYLHTLETGNFSLLLDFVRPVFSEFGVDVSSSVSLDGVLNEYGKTIFSKNAFLNCIKNFKKQI